MIIKNQINNKIIKYTLFFFLSIYVLATNAQTVIENDTIKKKKYIPFIDSITLKKEKNYSLLVVPLASYQPETSLGLGIGNIFFLKPFNDSVTRASSFYGTFMYTLKKQLLTGFQTTYWHKKNLFSFGFGFLFQRFPYRFYGIGNSVDTYNEMYDSEQIKIDVSIRKKILQNVYFGVEYKYRKNKMLSIQKDGLFETQNIAGKFGSIIKGIETNVQYDNRNDEFYPSKGNIAYISISNFGGIFKGDFNFTKYKIELKKYYPLPYNQQHILACRFLAEFGNGTIPFNYMSQLGGPNILRGYFEGKYRDKNIINTDIEYRFPITNRIKFHVFSGFGAIGEDYTKFKQKYFKLSGGSGLRYKIFKNRGMHIRLDVGFGYKTWGTYVQLSEAF
jgi:hypothetical protein